MTRPQLTFFCELDAMTLEALFSDPKVVTDLIDLQAAVSLGIIDLSPQRAEVVRRLNEAAVPVIAWQLLPQDEGYWFNTSNAPQARQRYAAFKAWTAAQNLQWAGIGIDIEPDIREIQKLLEQPWQLVPVLLKQLGNTEKLRQAQADYQSLVAQMQADGYQVDSYLIPFIIDERHVGATLLQRLAGLIDVIVDREVLMLYTSYARPRGQGILWSYAAQAQSVGVGNTGGGVGVGTLHGIPPLSWLELTQDLRLAQQWTDDIHIFCLEGCVANGLMDKLKTFDWSAETDVHPPENAAQINLYRQIFRTALWLSANPMLLVAGFVGLLWLVSSLKPNRRKSR